MTKKDLAFIKRIIGKPESTSVVKTVSCYVDINRDDIRFQEPQTFMTLDESELISTVLFLKKAFPENLVQVPLKSKLRKIS